MKKYVKEKKFRKEARKNKMSTESQSKVIIFQTANEKSFICQGM